MVMSDTETVILLKTVIGSSALPLNRSLNWEKGMIQPKFHNTHWRIFLIAFLYM